MRGCRGGARGPDPSPCKITEIKDFLEILVRILWKITKLPSQHSMLGHHRLNDGTFMWYFGPLSPRQLKTPLSAPSDKTFSIRACNPSYYDSPF